jgi:hypothetical protein
VACGQDCKAAPLVQNTFKSLPLRHHIAWIAFAGFACAGWPAGRICERGMLLMNFSKSHATKILYLLIAVFLVACDKKQKEVMPSSPPAPSSKQEPAGLPSDIPLIASNAPIVIPDAVKGKWKAVKLAVHDKKDQASKEYQVGIHSDFIIPDSGLTVKVGEFLPDLKIQDATFTSETNEPRNPAIHVIILDENKEVFNGWLFSLFPTIHPFRHDRYGIILKEAIPAG